MARIILASASKQRQALFSALELNFEVIPSEIDEKAIRDTDLAKQAELIARAKAESVAGKEQGIVIAADTFVEIGGHVLEKPEGPEEAKQMLGKLSNSQAQIYTGFCYLDSEAPIDFSACVQNTVHFRALDEQEIGEYVKKFPVTTWSGAFSPAYPYGLTLFKNINGAPSTFTHGLPMHLVIPLLKKSGVEIKPK